MPDEILDNSTEDGEDEGQEQRLLRPAPLTGESLCKWHRNQGLTGLRNLGNTCYLNSVVQALSNVPHLSLYFVSGWEVAVPRLTQNPPQENRPRYTFVMRFAEVMRSLWLDGRRTLQATALTKSVVSSVPEFQQYGQQDAHEALSYALNNLHDELFVATPPTNHPARRALLRLQREQEDSNRRLVKLKAKRREEKRQAISERRAALAEGKDCEEDEEADEEPPTLRQLKAPYQQSIVSDAFQTVLVQEVRCRCCGNVSRTVEEHLELSLALPSKNEAKELRRVGGDAGGRESGGNAGPTGGSGGSRPASSGGDNGGLWGTFKSFIGMSGSPLHLEDCLRSFFAPERVLPLFSIGSNLKKSPFPMSTMTEAA